MSQRGDNLVQFDYTDAWHPTVNPSARMPINYLRHIALLGHNHGILNEFPRHNGGTTIRLQRFHDGQLNVVPMPGRLKFAPWWIPSSETQAVASIKSVFDSALAQSEPSDQERSFLARLRDLFTSMCKQAPAGFGLTVGEALWRAADQLHRELIPDLPALELVSLTRSPVRTTLAHALSQVPGGLIATLGRWGRAERMQIWPLLAVGISDQGLPTRIRLHVSDEYIDTEPLPAPRRSGHSRPVNLSEDDLIRMLLEGRLIPGSRLTAVAETVSFMRGNEVRHFGNTYGNFLAAGQHVGAIDAERIPCCADDEDSWHYADLPLRGGGYYPLHLVELGACSAESHRTAARLITKSLTLGAPIHLEVKENLDACLRGGGS
jgi:hypothetical protein